MGLITLSIVFLALSGIALIIYGVKFLVPLIEAGSRKPKAPVEGVPVVRKEIVPSASPEARPLNEDVEAEVIAAIAAAVAVLTGGKGEIVSVRPAAPACLKGGLGMETGWADGRAGGFLVQSWKKLGA